MRGLRADLQASQSGAGSPSFRPTMDQTAQILTPPSTRTRDGGWLAGLLRCPQCGASGLDLRPEPRCDACDYVGRSEAGIPDFVQASDLTAAHEAEMAAQHTAVGAYYENDRKLCCHWDRMSADDIPALLGLKKGAVLDLGCGTGTAGMAVRRSGPRVVGADLSLACLEAARHRLDAIVRVEAASLPFRDGAFEGVIARGALHHLHDPETAIEEAKRVLAPGGRAVFMDPREFAWLEPIKDRIRQSDHSFSDDHRAFGLEDYTSLIGRAFEIERAFTIHPFGILMAAGLDLLPLPKQVPSLSLAKVLLGLDRALNKTPLARAGHLLVVVAR